MIHPGIRHADLMAFIEQANREPLSAKALALPPMPRPPNTPFAFRCDDPETNYVVAWSDRYGESFEVIIPRGAQVARNMADFYWANHNSFWKMLDRGVRFEEARLVNADGEVEATMTLAKDIKLRDLAWLSCFFYERMQCEFAFPFAEGDLK
jgi:hypothetical protein